MTRSTRVVLAALVLTVLAAPGVAQAADWSQFHGSAARTGVALGETTLTPSTVAGLHVTWGTPTGLTTEGINSSPAVVNGVVYIGSDDMKLWALDEATGAPLWTYKTGGPITSSPTVDAGVVFFGSADGKVYAVDAVSGQLLWAYTLGGTITASPLVAGGMVYIGSRSGQFVGLNEVTGTKVWQTNPWAVWQSASYANGTVYVGSDKSAVFAYDALTGAVKWTAPMGTRIRCTPSIAGGIVYVGTDKGKVVALDANTGTQLWINSAVAGKFTPVVRSAPAVDNGEVFVTTGESTPMDGHTVAFDALTGRKLWTAHMADYSTSSPGVVNGMVFVGSYDHRLYAFDERTGALLWAPAWPALPRGLNSSPAIANGHVYVGCRDGSVYAFGL